MFKKHFNAAQRHALATAYLAGQQADTTQSDTEAQAAFVATLPGPFAGQCQADYDGFAKLVTAEFTSGLLLARVEQRHGHGASSSPPGRGRPSWSTGTIVRNALRAAAIAPSDGAALDIAGAALTRLAYLARREVRHG